MNEKQKGHLGSVEKKRQKTSHDKDSESKKIDKEIEESVNIMYQNTILEKYSYIKRSDIKNVTKLSEGKRVGEVKLENGDSVLIVGKTIDKDSLKILEIRGNSHYSVKSSENNVDSITYMININGKDSEFSLDKKTGKIIDKQEEKEKAEKTKKAQEARDIADKLFSEISRIADNNGLSVQLVTGGGNKGTYDFYNNINGNRNFLASYYVDNFPNNINAEVQKISNNRGVLCMQNVINGMNNGINPKINIANAGNGVRYLKLGNNTLPDSSFGVNAIFNYDLRIAINNSIIKLNNSLNQQNRNINHQGNNINHQNQWPADFLMQNPTIKQTLNANQIRMEYSKDGQYIIFRDNHTNAHFNHGILSAINVNEFKGGNQNFIVNNINNLVNNIGRNKLFYSNKFKMEHRNWNMF